ncbi:MAG: hypothetical protein E7453_06205 [Ruminococcaceae bacterium]|nr:hypothetical protein [Oscillospiraceae bacterium]
MNAKLKILYTGRGTIVELDGKTIGTGVEAIEFRHETNKPAKANLSINLSEFSFMPDGHFDEACQRVKEANPPEDHLIGRK